MDPVFLTILVIAAGIPVGKSIAEQTKPHSDSWTGVWMRGAAISAGLAAFAFITTGQASCNDYDDPVRGSCISYADDGYEWTASRAVQNGWNVFWKTAAAGTIGMLLLKRELEKAQGGPVDFGDVKRTAIRLASNREEFTRVLKSLVTNISVGNHKSSQFKNDFSRVSKSAKMALDLVEQGDNEAEKQFYRTVFNNACDAASRLDASGTIFKRET